MYFVFRTPLHIEESSLLNVGRPAHVTPSLLLYVQFDPSFLSQQKLIDFSSPNTLTVNITHVAALKECLACFNNCQIY